MPIAPSAQIGRYRVVSLVGSGGMGEVYQMEESDTGQPWALKTLLRGKEGSDLWRRFMNEGQIHSSLQHSGIAAFREMFLYGSQPCIVMEFVDGETMGARLARLGKLDPRETAQILSELCDALSYLHSKGIIHRDLKASNIKINSAGQVKLLDFGIARAEGGQRLTRVGAVMGTPEMLAPELLDGKPASSRTEIWGLGVLGYEMVTGVLPFEGGSDEDLYRAVRSRDPVPPSQINAAIPPDIEKLLLRCLEKNPAKRYASIAALKLALRACLGPASGGEAFVGGLASARWKPSASKRVVIGALITAALLIAAFYLTNNGTGDSAQTITIEAADGPAAVYENGERIGTTPYRRRARVGDAVSVELRRSGYLSQPVQFDITERKVYSYTLQRASR